MLNPFLQLIPLLLIIILIVLFIWPLVDILSNEFTGNNKVIWLLMTLFLPPLGGILYLMIGQRQRIINQNGGE